MSDIMVQIGLPALLEQLAEECGELTQAALKLARLRRGENPTPKTEQECIAGELADAGHVAHQLQAKVVVQGSPGGIGRRGNVQPGGVNIVQGHTVGGVINANRVVGAPGM